MIEIHHTNSLGAVGWKGQNIPKYTNMEIVIKSTKPRKINKSVCNKKLLMLHKKNKNNTNPNNLSLRSMVERTFCNSLIALISALSA